MDNKKEKKKRNNAFFALCPNRIFGKFDLGCLRGSYTIEAAIIVPLIFVLLVGVLFTGLYLRDAAYIKAVAVKTAFEYTDEGTGREILKDKLSSGLMTMDLASVVYNRSTEEAVVKVHCKYSIPFKYIRHIMEKVLGEIEVEVKQTNLDGRKDILRSVL